MTNTPRYPRPFSWTANLCLAALLAACSGGGGGQQAADGTADAGSVMLVVDTAAGDETLVQFQVAGAVLEQASGATTGNVLAEVAIVTFDDPSGQASGVQLRDVPAGDYTAVHLVLAPGSGYSLAADGTAAAVLGPVDLRIAIDGGLQHDARRASWLVVGHDVAPLATIAGELRWNPVMSARGDREPILLGGLTTPVVTSSGVTVSAPELGSAPLFLEIDEASTFEAEDGTPLDDQAAFLAELAEDEQIDVFGDLCRDGRVRAGRLRRCRGNDHPRLIGRIQSLDAEHQLFEMRVQALNAHGHHDILAESEDVVVRAIDAVIRRPNGDALTFADLTVNQLVKVRWLARSTDGAGRDVFLAGDIEVPGHHSGALHPQWRGRVTSIDLVAGTFVMVPYGSHAIVIGDVAVSEVTVVVGADTTFEFDDVAGTGLEDLVAGVSRVRVRGSVDDAGAIVADRVWVQDHDEGEGHESEHEGEHGAAGHDGSGDDD